MSGELICEACGSVDVERDDAVGLGCCRECQHVFSLPTPGPAAHDAHAKQAAYAQQAALLELEAEQAMLDQAFAVLDAPSSAPASVAMATPSTITERESADELLIEVRWYTSAAVPISLFALVWNGMLMAAYVNMVGNIREVSDLFTLLFPAGHLAVGLALGYFGLALLVNSTTLRVDRQGLHVSHGPLPWMGARDIPVGDIDQLYVVERIVRSKNSVNYLYDVRALLAHNDDIVLVKGMRDAPAAKFLEGRIEQWLGITNRAVAGEHR